MDRRWPRVYRRSNVGLVDGADGCDDDIDDAAASTNELMFMMMMTTVIMRLFS